MGDMPSIFLQDQTNAEEIRSRGTETFAYLRCPRFIDEEDNITGVIIALGEMEALEGRASLISIYKKFKYRKWNLSQKCVLIRALGQAGGEEAHKILQEMLKNEQNPIIKEEIALFIKK